MDGAETPGSAPSASEGHHPHRGWWRQFARPLDGIGKHPDYRFTLANERTFLAWIRTALALVAGGIAVVQLVPEFFVHGGRLALGVVLVLLAVLVSATSYFRWARNEVAIRRDEPLAVPRMPWILTAGLVLIAILSLVFIVFGKSSGS